VKKVRTTPIRFDFCKFFSCGSSSLLKEREIENAAKARVTAEKTPKRAGATPLFRLSAAQKVRGSLPPLQHGNSCCDFFPRWQDVRKK
jgi:hypothetical protein